MCAIKCARWPKLAAGTRAWSPYRWTLPEDAAGTVNVEIAVTNTLLPFVEGRISNAESGAAHKF